MKIYFLPHLESFMSKRKFESKFFKKNPIQPPNGVLPICKLPFSNGSYPNNGLQSTLGIVSSINHWSYPRYFFFHTSWSSVCQNGPKFSCNNSEPLYIYTIKVLAILSLIRQLFNILQKVSSFSCKTGLSLIVNLWD